MPLKKKQRIYKTLLFSWDIVDLLDLVTALDIITLLYIVTLLDILSS